MAGLTIKIIGGAKLLDAVKKVRKDYPQALEAGIFGLGNDIMTDSKRRVPVDLGALKGSGYVTLPRDSEVEIGYGGPAKAYAVVQHERTEYRHETGEAKYLENAVNAHSAGALRRIADIARNVIKGGVRPLPKVHPEDPDSGGG